MEMQLQTAARVFAGKLPNFFGNAATNAHITGSTFRSHRRFKSELPSALMRRVCVPWTVFALAQAARPAAVFGPADFPLWTLPAFFQTLQRRGIVPLADSILPRTGRNEFCHRQSRNIAL